MGQIILGPKSKIKQFKASNNIDISALESKISELEQQLKNKEETIVEIIKEVPILKEIKVVEEKLVEVPVDRIVEIIKEIKIVEEKIIEKPVEIIKEIEKILERPVEVIKEVEKYIITNKIPLWLYGAMGIEFLIILFLLIK